MNIDNVLLFFATLFLLVAAPAWARGQSIQTQAPTGSVFCAGQSITVGFVSAGSFGPDNVFIAQLSAPDGGFTSGFVNMGSLSGTQSGEIAAVIPDNVASGHRYRIRVISSAPFVEGADNGDDITVENITPDFAALYHGVNDHVNFNLWLTDRDIVFENRSTPSLAGAEYVWEFGDDATPKTATGAAPPPVQYSTPGVKTATLTVSVPSGCSYSISRNLKLFPITPRITPDALIAKPEGLLNPSGETNLNNVPIWVCPGGVYDMPHPNFPETAVVERGGILRVGSEYWGFIYLKSGAVMEILPDSKVHPNIIYEEGASIIGDPDGSADLLLLDSVRFDYTEALEIGCIPLEERPTDTLRTSVAIAQAHTELCSDVRLPLRLLRADSHLDPALDNIEGFRAVFSLDTALFLPRGDAMSVGVVDGRTSYTLERVFDSNQSNDTLANIDLINVAERPAQALIRLHDFVWLTSENSPIDGLYELQDGGVTIVGSVADFETTVAVSQRSARIGDTLHITLLLEGDGADITALRNDLAGYSVSLAYNPTVLIPGFEAVQRASAGGLTESTILREGSIPQEAGILEVLPFTVALGDAAGSPLVIQSFHWLNCRSAPIEGGYSLKHGAVNVENIADWPDGGLRLINPQPGRLRLTISPNPVAAQTTITIRNAAPGATLTIYTVLGIRVLDISDRMSFSSIESSVMLSATEFPASGQYLCRLTSRGHSIVRMLIVQ